MAPEASDGQNDTPVQARPWPGRYVVVDRLRRGGLMPRWGSWLVATRTGPRNCTLALKPARTAACGNPRRLTVRKLMMSRGLCS